MKFTYLFIDLFSVIIPLLFSFHPSIKFYKDFKAFFAANLISALCFSAWDIIFTKKGIWGFNEKFTMGIEIYNLPVEEVLFFFCIPFACVFTYKCLNSIFKKRWNPVNEERISFLFVIIFFIAGMFFWRRTYTAVVFISFSILLFLFRHILHQLWIGNLYRTWIILLVPFFIVNGILTGTGLSSPVVWYNNEEIIRVRILTIPIEDIVYGFELVMLTVFFYEIFLIGLRPAEKTRARLSLEFNSDE